MDTQDHQLDTQSDAGEPCLEGTDACWVIFLLPEVEIQMHTGSSPQPRNHQHQERVLTRPRSWTLHVRYNTAVTYLLANRMSQETKILL